MKKVILVFWRFLLLNRDVLCFSQLTHLFWSYSRNQVRQLCFSLKHRGRTAFHIIGIRDVSVPSALAGGRNVIGCFFYYESTVSAGAMMYHRPNSSAFHISLIAYLGSFSRISGIYISIAARSASPASPWNLWSRNPSPNVWANHNWNYVTCSCLN